MLKGKEIEKYRDKFIRLSQFVFNRSAEDIRNDIYESLIMNAFFNQKNRGVSYSEINKYISEIIPILPSNLKEHLSELQEKGKLIFKKGKYFMVSSVRKELLKEKRFKDDLLNYLLKSIISRVRKIVPNITHDEEETVKKDFLVFLSKVFTRDSFVNINSLCGISYGKDEELLKLGNIIKTVDDLFEEIRNKKLKKAERRVFIEILKSDDEKIQEFLYSTALNYIIIQILNLDPDCQKLQLLDLSKMHIYLDTNILISVVCPVEKQHLILKELLKLMKKLGVKTFYTMRTATEFEHRLNDADSFYKNLSSLKSSTFKRIVENIDDPFIRSFWQEKKTNTGLSWDGYYYSILPKLRKSLKEFNILLDKEVYKKYSGEKGIVTFSQKVNDCAYLWGEKKSKTVAEHDGFHLFLIHKLRQGKETGLIGPYYWFLTADRTLYCVSHDLGLDFPLSITIDAWIELMSIFAPLKNYQENKKLTQKVFLKLMAAILEKRNLINPDIMVKLTKWINFDDLETEDIIKITSLKVTNDYIKRIQEAEEKGKQQLIPSYVEKLKEEKDLLIRRKLEETEKELKKERETRKSIEKEIRQWKKYFVITTILFPLILIDFWLYLSEKISTIKDWATIIGVEATILFGILALIKWIKE